MASFERALLSSACARVSYFPTLNEPYVSFTFADHDQDFSASGLPPLVLSFTATGRPKKPPRLNTHTKDTALNALRAQWLSSYNELFGAEQQKQLLAAATRRRQAQRGYESRYDSGHRNERAVQRATARRGHDSRSARDAQDFVSLRPVPFATCPTFSIGRLGACPSCTLPGCSCVKRYQCTHCGALLFRSEARPAGKKRGPFGTAYTGGMLCCLDGKTVLPPIRRHEAFEALWVNPQSRGILMKYGSSFNNALALASTYAKPAPVPGGGWRPSIVIQGKWHHRIAGLARSPSDGADGPGTASGANLYCAMLYVNDQRLTDANILKMRMSQLNLPKEATKAEKDIIPSILTRLTTELRRLNRYVACLPSDGDIRVGPT